MCLYSAEDEAGKVFEEIPFYVSKQIRVESPFLHRTLLTSEFVLTDGSRLKASYSIRFRSIEEINGKYYLVASMMNRSSWSTIDNVLITVKKALRLKYEALLRVKIGSALAKLKLKSGQVIDSIVIEKVGGWQ